MDAQDFFRDEFSRVSRGCWRWEGGDFFIVGLRTGIVCNAGGKRREEMVMEGLDL